MKILLDQPRCEGHGLCEEAAPEVYELDDEAIVVVRREVQARAAVRALLHGDQAAPYRPSQYRRTEQFGLDVKMVGALDPQGEPAVLDGSLDHGDALLAWPGGFARRTGIAVNHHTPPAKLKRLLKQPARS